MHWSHSGIVVDVNLENEQYVGEGKDKDKVSPREKHIFHGDISLSI